MTCRRTPHRDSTRLTVLYMCRWHSTPSLRPSACCRSYRAASATTSLRRSPWRSGTPLCASRCVLLSALLPRFRCCLARARAGWCSSFWSRDRKSHKQQDIPGLSPPSLWHKFGMQVGHLHQENTRKHGTATHVCATLTRRFTKSFLQPPRTSRLMHFWAARRVRATVPLASMRARGLCSRAFGVSHLMLFARGPFRSESDAVRSRQLRTGVESVSCARSTRPPRRPCRGSIRYVAEFSTYCPNSDSVAVIEHKQQPIRSLNVSACRQCTLRDKGGSAVRGCATPRTASRIRRSEIRTAVRASRGMEHERQFVFFWTPEGPNGHFGNWFPSPFQDKAGHVFSTSEHYMMWRKALLMQDTATATKVLAAATPKAAKSLGRTVRTPEGGWDEDLWVEHRRQIMVDALLLKFQQHPELLEALLATGDSTLVEASPLDRIWGIGLRATDPLASQPDNWRGLNLLGECLMVVRKQLRAGQRH